MADHAGNTPLILAVQYESAEVLGVSLSLVAFPKNNLHSVLVIGTALQQRTMQTCKPG